MIGLVLAVHFPALGRTPQAIEVELKAQPLADSLKAVAELFALQIAFLPEDVRNIEAPALSGLYTADQAFTVLLEGSPLEHRFVGKDSVAIFRRRPADQLSPAGAGHATGPIAAADTETASAPGAAAGLQGGEERTPLRRR